MLNIEYCLYLFIYNWFSCNCIHLSQIVLVLFNIVEMLLIIYCWDVLYQFIKSTGLVNFNTGDFCKWMLLYLFQFSFPHLPIWQRLLWNLDLDSCFRFADWSFILVNGNFIWILILTVVCFVSHHVLLS